MAYEKTSINEKFLVDSYSIELPNNFAVNVEERQNHLPTMYWLHKLHKRPYIARLITPGFFYHTRFCTPVDRASDSMMAPI